MSYAYLDKYGIMHVVDNLQTAREYSGSGNVVTTEIANSSGYPEVDGKHVIVYATDKKFKVNGVEYPLIELKKYPDVWALLEQLS